MRTQTTWSHTIGLLLTRVIVPLWVLFGAVFKLYERTPSNLPSAIVKAAKPYEALEEVMRALIGLELFAVGVMLFLPRLAKSMAIFMLSMFCLILLNEMRLRATSCGCMGSIKIEPWHMLVIDGSLLIGVLVFGWASSKPTGSEPSADSTSRPWALKYAATMLGLLIVGMAVSFGIPKKPDTQQPPVPPPQNGNTEPTTIADPTANTSPQALPNYWYVQDITTWIGKPWRELELFKFMPKWPRNLDQGTRYVVFYSRTCEHCEAMFNEDLATNPSLSQQVTAVEIPANSEILTAPEAWEMPPTQCEHLALPLGTDWGMITAPLAVKIVDGKVVCATEGDHKKCLDLE